MFKKAILLSAVASIASLSIAEEYKEPENICHSSVCWYNYTDPKLRIYGLEPPITLGKAHGIRADFEKFYCSSMDLRVQIKQKAPCYIVPKDQVNKVKKIDENTVEIQYEVATTGIQSRHRSGVRDYTRTQSGEYRTDGNYTGREPYVVNFYDKPIIINDENSVQILGNSMECVKESNEEIWIEICDSTGEKRVSNPYKTIP